MVSWKIFRESAAEVVGENLVELVEKSFKKTGKEIDPSKFGDILLHNKKIDESERDLLNEAYELLKQEEEARTIPGDSEEPEDAMTFADDSEIFAQPKPGLPKLKKFTLIDIIGQGGMGRVYKGVDPDLGRPVAVKEILGEAKEWQKQRFQREILLTAKLDQEHRVIRARAVDKDDKGNTYFVMDFVEGKELTEYVENIGRGRTYSMENAIELLAEALDAMAIAHEQGIIHRDIKPDNIMADRRNVKIMDWGLAKEIDDEEIEADEEDLASTNISRTATYPNLTQDGVAMGTPRYMSPEQAINAKYADERSDIYSFGAILYEMLTGQSPNVTNIKKKRKENIDIENIFVNLIDFDKPALPPSKLSKNVPPELESICMKALAKDPDERYQTAEEFRDDLRAYLKKESVKVHKYSIFSKVSRFVQRHPAGTLAAFLGTMLIAGGVLGAQAVNSANLKAKSAEIQEELAKEKAEKEKQAKIIAEMRAQTAETEVKGQSQSLNKLQSLEHLAQNENYYSAALQIINEAVNASDQFWKPYLVRAKHYAEFGHHEEAEADFERAQELFREQHKKESVEIWFEAGMYYGLPATLGGRGLEDRALEYFEKASTAGPTTPFGKLSRAVALIIRSRQEPDNAEETLPEAIGITEELTIDDIAKNIDATWLVSAWALGATVFAGYESNPVFLEYANLEEAKEALLKITDEKQINLGLANFLATLYDASGEQRKAIQIYSALLNINERACIYNNRGTAYLAIDELDKALSDFNKAISLNRRLAVAFIGRGITYRRKGNLEQAIEDFDKAAELDQNLSVQSHINRGLTYVDKKDLVKAIEEYRRALRISPTNPLALFNLGCAYYLQNNIDMAIESFDRAIEINKKYINAYLKRGQVYGRKGLHDEEMADYNRAIEINPDHIRARHFRGHAYLLRQELDKALEDLNYLLALNKNHIGALNDRASVYSEKGDHIRSIQDNTRSIQLDPNNGNTYNNRGNSYIELDRYSEAESDLERAVELGFYPAYITQGSLFIKKGEYERARQSLQEAYKKAPQYKSLIDEKMQELERRIKEK
jgi:serine/threonine protein kinase/Tfp pilus assembly protein PilF